MVERTRRQKVAYRRYTDEERIMALELMALGTTLSEVSRRLKIPKATLSQWNNCKTQGGKKIKDEMNKEEYERIRTQKKQRFIEKASEIIEKTLLRLDKQIEDESERISARDLSVILGTIYDKRALASNEATVNAGIKIVIEGGGEGFAD